MIKILPQKLNRLYQRACYPFSPTELKRKAIFIHIPKAAGTSVRVALGESARGRLHIPWWVYEQASPRKFKEFYKFAFVRNPLDRTFSGYNYLKTGGNQMEDLVVSQQIKKYSCFNEFVEAELISGKMIYHPIFRTQTCYLCNWKGEIKVDFVGKFENIDFDFKAVAAQLKITNTNILQKLNQSKEAKETVEENTKKIIRELYKDDYDIFGY
ncbi:sulfotransferase family 2 domain-containing protein [Aestuariirhabdus litorea]|nr:sulfotransferase family 2 domain-containing protein [Aestuariirhabdus litorea]